MMEVFQRRGLASWGRIALAGIAAAVLMTGCGGGGGGGGSSTTGGTTTGGGSTQTVSVTGVLKDKTTGNVLPSRTVSVENTSLSATSDSTGTFTIGSVPVESITLSIVDSNGTSDGTATYNLSSYSGNPRNIGTVTLDVSSDGGPPPPPT
jgi:hypothetical protein